MHDTALRLGRLAIEIYGQDGRGSILDIGSADINGSLRQFVTVGQKYVGVDLEEGPNVDVVMRANKPLPFEDAAFDLVVATSVLEHDPAFWLTFLEMCRMAAPGGHIYFNAPSNGLVHRYPEDHWRFYPDCGKALARWAVSQGWDVELVESFTARREADIWNDFVAVFRKLPVGAYVPKRALHSEVPCNNIVVGTDGELMEPAYETEDMGLLRDALSSAREAGNERDAIRARLEVVEKAYCLATAEQEALAKKYDAISADLLEAIERGESLASQVAQLNSEKEEHELKLSKSEKWNFELARERAKLEKRVEVATRESLQSRQEATIAKELARKAETESIMMAQQLAAAEINRQKAEDECSALKVIVSELEGKLEARQAELERLRDDLNLLSVRLQERNREVGTLSMRFAAKDRDLHKAESDSNWLAEVGTIAFENSPWWWCFFGERKRMELLQHLLQKRGLFDADAYLRRYPDVKSSGMLAIVHYLRHGRKEDRSLL